MKALNSAEFKDKEIIEHLDGTVTEYSYFEPAPEAMDRLVKVLFDEHWKDVVVGPCIEGAVFEIRFSEAPKLTVLDGYLTVNLGPWHFHLSIAPHKGNRSLELRRNRQAARVALFDTRVQGCGGGRSWGVRMWNGFDEQMTTVFPSQSSPIRGIQVAQRTKLGTPPVVV
jgi:hypothetical protein